MIELPDGSWINQKKLIAEIDELGLMPRWKEIRQANKVAGKTGWDEWKESALEIRKVIAREKERREKLRQMEQEALEKARKQWEANNNQADGETSEADHKQEESDEDAHSNDLSGLSYDTLNWLSSVMTREELSPEEAPSLEAYSWYRFLQQNSNLKQKLFEWALRQAERDHERNVEAKNEADDQHIFTAMEQFTKWGMQVPEELLYSAIHSMEREQDESQVQGTGIEDVSESSELEEVAGELGFELIEVE